MRSVREIPLSSLLIVVLLRLAHWNFAAGRDAFFNRALAALFGNLAAHGVQHMHQHCAKRIFEVANLLARNAVKLKAGSSLSGLAQAAEQHRARRLTPRFMAFPTRFPGSFGLRTARNQDGALSLELLVEAATA